MTRPLWTLGEIVAATGGRLEPSTDQGSAADTARGLAVTGISIDTRTLEPGDLFVPLTDARDGHEFVTAAFARGAAAALVRDGYARQPGDGLLVRVPDAASRDSALAALVRIGAAARARLAATARVIAVTGSAGKTGTKEMLRACLKACASSPDRVHAPEKSFNNHWGVPLTLARMPADTERAVFEIGMNHAGEIRPLTKLVRPHIAIVTNVLPVHVGNFADGIDGVARAKAEIFEGLEPGGTAIVPWDNQHFETLRREARQNGAIVKAFSAVSRDARSDAWLVQESEQVGPPDGPKERVIAATKVGVNIVRLTYELGTPGGHIAGNSLAVVLALGSLGRLSNEALAPLVGVRPSQGRGQRIRLEGSNILLIDESYNANPRSMHAAIIVLSDVDVREQGRRIAVLGDMLELGADAVHYHVGLKVAAAAADLVLCCGPDMRHLHDALPAEKRGGWAPTSTELIPLVLATLRPGDAVMVKGSLGTRMAPIVEAIKKHFAGTADRG
jgi:UDP-N-acetylmuramoyl-tripeptide--D-alanyl-D-alanine ligase